MAKNVDGSIYFGIGLDNDQLRRDAQQSQKILADIGNASVSEGARIDTAFKNIARSAGLVFGAKEVIQFGRSIIQVRGEFQKLETAFSVLLGSKANADRLMADMVRLAAETPFGLQDVANGAKQLLAYGFAAKDITEDLRRLGDVSAALGLPLERMTYLYGTTMTQGRLYARDLMQFTTSGIPMVQALADQFGVSTGEVQKLVEAGKIGFPEVQKAIYAMTDEGGQFNNMTNEMSKTIPGQIEKLKDAWQAMLNDMGKSQEGFINDAIGGAAHLVENYEKVGKLLIGLVATYGAYRAAIIAVDVIKAKDIALDYAKLVVTQKLQVAQKLLNKTMLSHPLVLITTLVVGLATAMWALRDSSTATERAQEQLNKRQNEFNKQEQNRRARIDELVRTVQDENQTLYAQITAYEELQKLSPALTAAYTREKLAMAELTDVNKELNAEQDNRNYDEITSNINNTKARIDELNQTLSNAWEVFKRGGSGENIRLREELETQKSALATLEGNLSDYNRRIAEAEFNAMPPADKIKIKEEQLEKIRAELDKVNLIINEEMAKLPKEVQIPLRVEVTGDGGWEGYRPDFLNPLNIAQMQANALHSNEAAIQAELNALNPTTDQEDKLSEEEKQRLADEARRRREQAQMDAEALKKLEIQFADDVVQAKINAMDDGLAKTLAQNELNFQRELAQIKEQENELLAARQATLPQGELATLTDAEQLGFTAQHNAAFTELLRSNEEARQAETDRLNGMLRDYQTYQQKMSDIATKYAKERENVLAAGGGEENIALVNEAERNAVDALDLEYAQKESTFRAWMNQLSTQTLEELNITLINAKDALASAEAAGATDQQLASARAAVNEAGKAVEEASEAVAKETPAEKKFKSWQKLYSTLQKVSNEFGEIGDAIGGTAGEAIKTAGTIATSTLSGISAITQLANWSVTATQMAAQGASAAIIAVEKASVILAVISTAMQVVTSIVGLFKKDDYTEQFMREVRALNTELELLGINLMVAGRAHETIFGADVWRQSKDDVNAATQALDLYNKTAEEMLWGNKLVGIKGLNPIYEAIKLYDNLTEAVANMQVKVDDANYFLGIQTDSADYKNLKSLVPQLFDPITGEIEMEALKKFVNDRGKVFENLSKQDQDNLTAMIGYWEAYEDAIQELRDYLTDVFGDLGNTFTDAIADAFSNGTDAAMIFKDSISDMLEQLSKQMVSSMMFDRFLKKAAADMEKATEIEDDNERFAAYASIMSGVVAGAIGAQKEAEEMMKVAKDEAAKQGIDIFGADEGGGRNTASQGLAQASQDSIDAMFGVFTNIENHTYGIHEMMKQSQQVMQANIGAITGHLSAIRDNTNRLGSIETNMARTASRLDDVVGELETLNRG